jgi:hypothetical protein
MIAIAAAQVISRPESETGVDPRRFPRRSICLLGRYTIDHSPEYPCQTINLSPGGAALFAPVLGRPGDRVILHIDPIGPLEGEILRVSRYGFALEFSHPLSSAHIQRFLGPLQSYNPRAQI